MYAITGASGQLGQLVIESLLKKVAADQIIATVRKPEDASILRAKGVTLRQADYDKPETLDAAFAGVD